MAAKRYTLLFFHISDDPDDPKPLKLHKLTHNWPTADFPTIIRMLRTEFDKEIRNLTNEATTNRTKDSA